MKTFYCTFAATGSLGDCYVKLEARNYTEAHAKMYRAFGSEWAFCYPEEKYEECIARFGLHEIPMREATDG